MVYATDCPERVWFNESYDQTYVWLAGRSRLGRAFISGRETILRTLTALPAHMFVIDDIVIPDDPSPPYRTSSQTQDLDLVS